MFSVEVTSILVTVVQPVVGCALCITECQGQKGGDSINKGSSQAFSDGSDEGVKLCLNLLQLCIEVEKLAM